ncbi:serine hydrolase domain-containing protein [Amycolatopsis jejuensis]|uniref:serine hydrolase domain-containing protein n=1 Tax=Amycolatopsis jejuensis TaxID=330084 RepID=UPI0006914EB7|nr:serine hydrolase domain-containing protein [Amycolatopsis jejuensis]
MIDLDAILEQAAAGRAVAGASVCLLYGAPRLASIGVERIGDAVKAGPDTLYPLGSVTKTAVATLVCRLVTDLDAPVAALVPELHDLGPRGAAITARMLLSHTSGLADAWGGADTLPELLSGGVAEPGKLFSYSNTGYVVLGRLIENITGTSWESALRREILDPAGITSADFSGTPAGAASGHLATGDGLEPGEFWPSVSPLFGPAGATLHTTAEDAARLVLACATGRTHDGYELLPERVVDEMLRVQTRLPGSPLHFRGWGLGWALPAGVRQRAVQHTGGTSAFVHVEPDRGVALAVLTNFPEGWAFGKDVLYRALGLRKPAYASGVRPEDPARYVGEYASRTFGIAVRIGGDGRLRVTNPLTGRETDLHHQAGDDFWADFGELETEVNFLDVTDGRASRVHLALRVLDRAS